MRIAASLALVASLFVLPASGADTGAAPVARVDPVRETHFGTEIVDPYRWMEAPDSAELKDFLARQAAYTKAQFARIAAPREKLHARIRELQNANAMVRFVARTGDRYLFLQAPPNVKDARLVTRAVTGGASTVVFDPAPYAKGDQHAAVGYYTPSTDGERVAFGLCHGGGEDCTLRIVETATGRVLPDEITDPLGWSLRWRPDDKGFYYARMQKLRPGAPETEKYVNIRIYWHQLDTPQQRDIAVFGPGVKGTPELPKEGFLNIHVARDDSVLIVEHSRGTIETPSYWARDAKKANAPWRRIASKDDQVRSLSLRGAQVYAITTRGGLNGQLVTFDAKTQTMADARELLPEGETIISTSGDSVVARDALYVAGHRDGRAVLRRLAYEAGAKPETLAMPAEGAIMEFTGDATRDGVTFDIDGPARAPAIYRYDPDARRTVDTGLRAPDPADYSDIVITHGTAPSTGGAQVPLTIIHRKDLPRDGNNPTLMIGYGSYGALVPMMFNAANLAWYERGGIIAYAHVRGGGEKGEQWHIDGQAINKQHTVEDFIASAQYLIDQRWTSTPKLAVAGKSAGGIPTGGLLTQRPDLVSAVLIRVGVTDMLSIERSAGGDANVPEYGSIRVEDQFRGLLRYSPYSNVKPGTKYPAVLLETGINDPRVPPWQLAKMTARLQAANASTNPILLRVDYDAGHGIGNDQQQVAALMADEFAFLGWNLGLDGFAPTSGAGTPAKAD